jgi:hypothetical protein
MVACCYSCKRLTNERDFPVPSVPRVVGFRQPDATMGSVASHLHTRICREKSYEHHRKPWHRLGPERVCPAWRGCGGQARSGAAECGVALVERVATLPTWLTGMKTYSGHANGCAAFGSHSRDSSSRSAPRDPAPRKIPPCGGIFRQGAGRIQSLPPPNLWVYCRKKLRPSVSNQEMS